MKMKSDQTKTGKSGMAREQRHSISVIVAACFLMASNVQLVSAQSYTHRFLGALGGSGSWASDINNIGQVVGFSNITGDTAVHATLWDVGGITDLGVLGGYASSMAFGINDAGNVVGRSIGTTGFVGTLWNTGPVTNPGLGLTVTNLGLGNNSTANGINSSGVVVATRLGSSPAQTATVDGAVISNRFQTSFLRPAINDAGQVVGESGNKAVLWENGITTVLGGLPGSSSSYAFAINNAGQIVGDSVVCGACSDRATLWQAGNAFDLGTLGGTDSVAVDINDGGQIVGNSKTTAGDYHATLWLGGSIFDLNGFLDASTVAAGWVLYEAKGINSNGEIVGGAFNTITMMTNAFLLTPTTPTPPGALLFSVPAPIPEPETYAMLIAGLGLLAWTARRRKKAGAAG
jgi:probable HAF family extracellular repeat protein